MATITWGSPVCKSSAWTTSAGRRLAVRKLESGNNTSTISPRLIFIVHIHFRSVPIVRERLQTLPQVGSLAFINSTFRQVDELGTGQKRHNHPCLHIPRCGFQQFHSPIAVYAFHRLADDIYRERIIRARRTSSAEKLMEGARLFDAVCERMKAGIRAQAPGADEDEVQQILLQHIRRLRNVEEHAVYTPLECWDDGR